MEKEKPNNQNKSSPDGYVIVPNYFLREWVKVLGIGPALLYLELLTYCHQEKDLAWPTLGRLSNLLGIAKTTLLRYLNTLIKSGLIKNISRDKSTTGHHKKNIYQILPLKRENGSKMPPGEYQKDTPYGSKLLPIRYQNETSFSSKTIPSGFQNDTGNGSKMKLDLVAKCYPNNNNINNTNITTTNREKDVVAVVDFIKLKEERRKRIKEDLTGLDFKASFREKLLKDFPLEKVEEKLELLKEKKHIINPSGWLMAALKNDYQDPEPEKYNEEPVGQASCRSSGNQKTLSREEKASSREVALEQIRKTRKMLANL